MFTYMLVNLVWLVVLAFYNHTKCDTDYSKEMIGAYRHIPYKRWIHEHPSSHIHIDVLFEKRQDRIVYIKIFVIMVNIGNKFASDVVYVAYFIRSENLVAITGYILPKS